MPRTWCFVMRHSSSVPRTWCFVISASYLVLRHQCLVLGAYYEDPSGNDEGLTTKWQEYT